MKSLNAPSGTPIQVGKVSPTGTPTTIGTYGFGNSGFSGIAYDPLTGGVIVAAEQGTTTNGQIALVNPTTGVASTLYSLSWALNPNANGGGQQHYAPDTNSPHLLYFYDNTLAKLFKLDRNTLNLTELLALDQTTPAGDHAGYHNDVLFDAGTGTLLFNDSFLNPILEYRS